MKVRENTVSVISTKDIIVVTAGAGLDLIWQSLGARYGALWYRFLACQTRPYSTTAYGFTKTGKNTCCVDGRPGCP